jgi:5-methyltetrahydropteroyltriglutamate--homocysteine methyltransferase
MENDFKKSVTLIQKAIDALGTDRIFIAPSCSLIHSPCDLDLESNEETLTLKLSNGWLLPNKKNRGGRCTSKFSF